LPRGDAEAVVALSLRAWALVFESFEQVLGQEIFRRIYPDWRADQSAAVAEVCRGPHVWIAAHQDRGPIGFVSVVLRQGVARSAEIDMIAVDPDEQGQGVATALVQIAVDFMRQEGIRLVEVATGGDLAHLPARRTYEKAGFVALPLVRYYRAL
jgi:GNAT superfamily N-acetyltransferase